MLTLAGEENPLPSISTSTLVPTRTALGVIESICTGVTTSTGAAAMRSPVGPPQGQSKGLPSKGTSTGKSSPSTSVSPRAVAVNWASPPAIEFGAGVAGPTGGAGAVVAGAGHVLDGHVGAELIFDRDVDIGINEHLGATVSAAIAAHVAASRGPHVEHRRAQHHVVHGPKAGLGNDDPAPWPRRRNPGRHQHSVAATAVGVTSAALPLLHGNFCMITRIFRVCLALTVKGRALAAILVPG